MTDSPKPPMLAGGRVMAVIPQSMEDTFRLATAIHKAQMAPRGLNTPEQIMVVIMRGLEVGMTPFQALDKIALVNGRPTIWGDGAVALVRASGLCEYIKEWVEGEAAYCETLRRGEKDSVLRFFSIKDAKQAGLWGKSGPWTQYPYRMLAMRARAFCLRDVYADVLGGMYLKEEIEETKPSYDPFWDRPPDPGKSLPSLQGKGYIPIGGAPPSPPQDALGKGGAKDFTHAELPENASDDGPGDEREMSPGPVDHGLGK